MDIKAEYLKCLRRLHLVSLGIYPFYEFGTWSVKYVDLAEYIPEGYTRLTLENWWDQCRPTMEEMLDDTWKLLEGAGYVHDKPEWLEAVKG